MPSALGANAEPPKQLVCCRPAVISRHASIDFSFTGLVLVLVRGRHGFHLFSADQVEDPKNKKTAEVYVDSLLRWVRNNPHTVSVTQSTVTSVPKPPTAWLQPTYTAPLPTEGTPSRSDAGLVYRFQTCGLRWRYA